MQFVDTHTHLYDPAFDTDMQTAVSRAEQAGVTRFILPDIDSRERGRMVRAAELIGPHAYVCAGLHPESVGPHWEEELSAALEFASGNNIVAIGEIGLDFHYPTSWYDQQCEVFRRQMIFAAMHDLPAIIHSRDATGRIFDVLDEVRDGIRGSGKTLRGVFHAFTGSYETFLRIRSYGDFLVGIGGVSTYRNAGIAATLERIPLDCILLETDSPYLPPVPHRGERNESAYIPLIADNIARIKGIEVDQVAAVTTSGALQLFNIKH